MKKFTILCLFVLLIPITLDSASSVARLATCVINQANSTNPDGSNCDAGLYCDSKVLICVLPSEQACSKAVGCTIGNKCFDQNNQIVTASSSGNGLGVCQTVTGNADKNALGDLFCNVYSFVTGTGGRMLAVFIIVFIGVSLLTGKAQPSMMIIPAIGIAFVFGAPTILSLIVGRATVC
jgi:type IV secretory pathway VirB2 component (pilin)